MLRELNEAIADAESRADRAFFEELLHPQFVMIRPSGVVATRGEFLDGLAAGEHPVMSDVRVTEFPEPDDGPTLTQATRRQPSSVRQNRRRLS